MESLVAALREEARASGERRVLVLSGDPDATRSAARDALAAAAIPAGETTVVGPDWLPGAEHLEPVRATDLLGRTRTAVVLDAHDAFRPNALGAAIGAVDGGGLLLLLAPPLDEWPDQRDTFDEGLAVPPFEPDDVAGNFRRRLVETLRVHPGIAIVRVDGGTEPAIERRGLTDPPPRVDPGPPSPPAEHAFPAAAYDACLTDDQVAAVRAFEALREPGSALVVEADRGRGKSSAAGLAAASLAREGRDVLVTAPQYRSCREVLVRAGALLSTLGDLETVEPAGVDRGALAAEGEPDEAASPDPAPRRLTTGTGAGQVRYVPREEAVDLPDDPDVVIVDEAAALPVRVLDRLLDAPAAAFTTTVHGYEGAGRGFSVRFRDRLAESDREVSDATMRTPIRYAPADPVESWGFRALMLDARPAVDPLVTEAEPDTVQYRPLSPDDLLADEHVLREAFGLLVLAHYRTEPDDLARVLDAPNVSVRVLLDDGHVVSVALLAREGDLSPARRADMYEGGRVKGNMIPDVLTTQLRDEAAGEIVGQRVLRIATHPAVRSRGLGSRLLTTIREEFTTDVDWLGVGYGATPALISFWADNGYRTVHLSTTRNDASGEYSAIMLDPCSPAGRDLLARHGEWFLDRIASVLSDPLDDADPDVVRGALAAAPAPPAVDLSEREWRLVAGVPGGASTFDTDPAPFRGLALRHLVEAHTDDESGEDDLDDESGEDDLTPRQERLLVRKVLQGHPWDDVAADLAFVSTAECMRELASVVEVLARRYGDETALAEIERLS